MESDIIYGFTIFNVDTLRANMLNEEEYILKFPNDITVN
jgi:hypothetical protein